MNSARLKKELKLAGAVLAALLAVAIPFLVLDVFWWSSAMSVGSLGALVAVTAYISSSRVAAMVIVAAYAVASTIAVALSSTTVAAAIFIAACAGLVAYSSRWGYAAAALLIGIMVPYNIHAPPLPLPNGDSGPLYYLAILVIALAAGFWAIAILAFALRRRKTKPVPLAPVPAPDALLGAVLIAAVSGGLAIVALTWFPATMWVWLLLTILLLTKPTKGLNLDQTRDRAVGTVIGAAAAGLVAVAGTPQPIKGLLALLCIVVALTVMLSGLPYWLYASFLTPGVVFMDSSPGDGIELAAERAALTLSGAAVAVGLSFLINMVVHWRRRRAGVPRVPAT
ncbi:MAG: FUSC family protein [Candidatus Nanopelagicales bacterium]